MEAVKVNDMEQELERSGAMMVKIADRLMITSNEDFEKGNAYLKDIKTRIKQVKDYWKEPKAAAQSAHKALCAREAQMLKPLENAESIIKKAMLDYTKAIEKARREAEEAAQREHEAEAKRLQALAAQAEEQGDKDTAEVIRDMAEAAPAPTVTVAAPKAKGLSIRAQWRARVTDPKLVPAYFEGFELRTIKDSALNEVARLYEGKANIPGVEFYQDSVMSVRT